MSLNLAVAHVVQAAKKEGDAETVLLYAAALVTFEWDEGTAIEALREARERLAKAGAPAIAAAIRTGATERPQ